MVRFGSIVMNVTDIRRAAEFWQGALGYVPAPSNPDFLIPPDGNGPRLHLDEDDRTHLDLWADTKEEQLAEVERLIALGAKRVDWVYPDGADFIVLADTEGNLFCVINTEG
jgi:catechol 2,3-dioxygenase-like lactoylglutathione lyase family enzyme